MSKVYEQPATVYGLRCYLFRFLSKLDIRTGRSYKFDVEPTTQAFISRCIFAYINVGVPDGVNMNGLRNVCALSVAMMYM